MWISTVDAPREQPLRTCSLIRFVIFDVDDVLLEMRRSLDIAERSTLAPLSQIVGKDATRVQARFSEIYATMIAQLRRPPGDVDPIAAELRKRINHWQRGLVNGGHEVKPWSRETMLAMALEDCGHKPSEILIRAACDRYWDTVSREAVMFDDARALIESLRKKGIAFHLATNSDGFMDLHEDWQTFFYDPIDAAARKIGRMRAIAAIGIQPSMITIGDPIGKPAPAFYQRVIAEFGKHAKIDLAETLVIGDSLTHDVLPFLSLGASRGIFLVRGEPEATTSLGFAELRAPLAARRALAPTELPLGVEVCASLADLEL